MRPNLNPLEIKFYTAWINMLSRCNNPKNLGYKNYGGRGIKCLWGLYEDFKKDMWKSFLRHCKGYGGRNTSLDRINNDGNYHKGNCRWATKKQQQLNRRNVKNRQNYL
jgi:hypothetical protein